MSASRVAPTAAPARPGPMDRRLLLLVYGLTVTGIVFVFSASFARAGREGGDGYQYLRTQAEFALAGLIIMLLLSRLRLRWIELCSLPAFGLFGALMLVAALWGREINGARCWIDLGPVQIQPSEFAKFALVIYLAALFASPLRAKQDPAFQSRSQALFKGAFASVVMLCLLLAQSDQGMALLMVLVLLIMFYLGGLNRLLLAGVGGGTVALGLVLAHLKPYIWIRIDAWLHPEKYLQGPGYHIYNMLIALSKGFVFGQGLGLSDDKWKTLPTPQTDSIFCVVGGELGLWGGLLLLGAMVLLGWMCLDIARRSESPFGWYAAVGCGALLVVQALINIAVATNSMPVTGLNLPFISAGGSSLASSMAAAGVILAISRHQSPRARSGG